MICEYPEYCLSFQCTADKCPDTCCAGWEVDVDDGTADYYRTLEGGIGEKIRRLMREEDGEIYFPMDEKGRCPFLDEQNLCEIYRAAGEESLCTVCTEYPRYFCDIGGYEQMDMSLSCPELARIFFTVRTPFEIMRSENDGYGEALSEEDNRRLMELVALRGKLLSVIWNSKKPLSVRIKEAAAMLEKAQGRDAFSLPDDGKRLIPCPEPDHQLIQRLGKMEILNKKWAQALKALSSDADRVALQETQISAKLQGKAQDWFTRLAAYYLFRYTLDIWFDAQDSGASDTSVAALLLRMLRTQWLFLMQRALQKDVSVQDMAEIAQSFSRQAEHSQENVELMKERI